MISNNKKNISNLKKNIPFMKWIIEVAEEKIIEHRLLKKQFNSNEEFIVFTIIWMRVFKSIVKEINDLPSDKDNKLTADIFIKNFYLNQKNEYLGMTINGVTRESEIPRSTVKRIIETLIKKSLVARNSKNLITPTIEVRDAMKIYRQYIFKSNSRIYNIFNELKLKYLYDEDEIFKL